jgi:hypothetical protein
MILSCDAQKIPNNSNPVSHDIWNGLLQKNVDANGHVNYKGFKSEEAQLEKYLNILRAAHPNTDKWSKDERLAYWINAYNAFTVELIIKNYPCKSIKDLGGAIYKVNTPWDIKFITIQGITYDLNNIEHDIIRKEFNEPRIHFAVNCASVSCPNLRNEAFVASRLNEQLDDQARKFINDKSKNNISANNAQLSKLFTWFKGDFTKQGTVVAFINKYSTVKLSEKAKIDYLEYNWNLNE